MAGLQDILNQVSLLTCFQGFILASALFFIKKGDSILNKILAVFLICFSWSGIYNTLDFMGYYGKYPAIMYTHFIADFISSPLLYLYVFRLTNKDFKIQRKTILHFIPALLVMMYYANYFVASLSTKEAIIQKGYNYFPYDVTVLSYLDIIYYMMCILISAFRLQRYKKQVIDFYSDQNKRNHQWLTIILIANMIAAILCFFLFGTGQQVFAQLIVVCSSFMIYAIGYKMLASPPILPDFITEPLIHPEYNKIEKPVEVLENKYERSGLSQERSEKIAEKILGYMQENKPYINPEINLKELAAELHIATHHLSQVINQIFKKNFYDFINEYRVAEVKLKLQDTKYQNYTLLAIGLESGFNSKATFNSVFKKITGQSPSEFKNTIHNSAGIYSRS